MWWNVGLFVLGMIAGAGVVVLALRCVVHFVILPSETFSRDPS